MAVQRTRGLAAGGQRSLSDCRPGQGLGSVVAGIAKACEQNLQKTLRFGGRLELPSSMELRALLVSVGVGPGRAEGPAVLRRPSGPPHRCSCRACLNLWLRNPRGRGRWLAQIPQPSLSCPLTLPRPRRAAVPRGNSFSSLEALNAISKSKRAP